MATLQDSSICFGVESTFKVGVTPARAVEFVDSGLDWKKGTKQGQGLRVGSRVARSGRRVNPTADGGGPITVEAISKGQGLLWQAIMGTSTSTVVSGATYQQVHTLGEPASLTIQETLVEAGLTLDPITFLGCMVDSCEIAFPNADIVTIKPTFDIADVTTATAYAAPSYPAEPCNLFHFANGSISTGTITAPTTTALASAVTPTVNIRGGVLNIGNTLVADRQNFGGAGRKAKQLRGLRAISGKLDIEYDSTTYRDLMLNDGALTLLVQFTGGALSTGVETLQIVLSELKFDTELPKPNGTGLTVQSMGFTALDNLTAAQPIWIVQRTADIAL